ncbi:MAG: nuclear transport factor 2 family protein [Micromonosporaceae bacterium]
MADLSSVAAWIDGYLRAWRSNEPADIGALFTEDAEYYTAPFDPPWRGREQIVAGWLAHRDEPGETTFDWRPVVITDEVAVIEATTTYPDSTYSNLWVIWLDVDGRCRHFTEWWMEHPAPSPE